MGGCLRGLIGEIPSCPPLQRGEPTRSTPVGLSLDRKFPRPDAALRIGHETPGRQAGFVAIFAQEVVKGQLPLSVEGLSGQGVEQFGRSEAFFSSLHYHLSFLDHVHEFDPDQRVLGCIKRFEPQHRPCHPLYCSMVLFHDVV